VRLRIKDITDLSVTQIFDELLRILKKENPDIVDQMLTEGLSKHDKAEMDLKAI
jgi:hypothetical protein